MRSNVRESKKRDTETVGWGEVDQLSWDRRSSSTVRDHYFFPVAVSPLSWELVLRVVASCGVSPHGALPLCGWASVRNAAPKYGRRHFEVARLPDPRVGCTADEASLGVTGLPLPVGENVGGLGDVETWAGPLLLRCQRASGGREAATQGVSARKPRGVLFIRCIVTAGQPGSGRAVEAFVRSSTADWLAHFPLPGEHGSGLLSWRQELEGRDPSRLALKHSRMSKSRQNGASIFDWLYSSGYIRNSM